MALFLTMPVSLRAAKVALFHHPDFVHVEPGNLFAEASNMKAALEAQGHEVLPFSDYSELGFRQVMADADLLIVPELERGNLWSALSSKTIDALRQYVDCGGGLIINGVVSSFSTQNNNAIELLNGAFGFALESAQIELSGTSVLNPVAAVGSFVGGPQTLDDNSANAYLWNYSLPENSRPLYHKSNQEDQVSVALMPYGAGQVLYLGWSWWNAAPVGNLNGGWSALMENSIEQLGCRNELKLSETMPAFNLSSSGELELSTLQIEPYLQLSCSDIRTVDIYPAFFNCDDIGAQSVLLTVQDQCGRRIEQ
ncbi:MAG: hypothetical protein AAFO94_21490, partial [Bacteroidota bacterium]